MTKNKSDAPVKAVDVWTVISDSAKAIVWLGAAVGGVVVILSTLGFFVLYSDDLFLGVELGLRDPLEYVTTGGLFLAKTASYTVYVRKLTLELVGSILVFAMMFLSYLVLKRWEGFSVGIRIIAVIGAILIQYSTLTRMLAVIDLSGFLIRSSLPDDEIIRLIVAGDYPTLEQYYGSLVASLLITTLTVGYWHWKSINQPSLMDRIKILNRFSILLKAIAAILTFSCFYMLPQIYANLVKRHIYPVITNYDIKKEAESVMDIRGHQLFLLYRNDKTVVIYDRSNLELIYLRSDIVNVISIGEYEFILRGKRLHPQSR